MIHYTPTRNLPIITRRGALKLKLAALMAVSVSVSLHWSPSHALAERTGGYGTDPDLQKRVVPWRRTLTSTQMKTLEPLCDIILPADPPHPSAGAVGLPGFLNEWLSAPYPQMREDRTVILKGLEELDEMALRSRGVPYRQANASLQSNLFQQMCDRPDGATVFPARLIELVCGGYYTTREGHAAIGYVGNIARESFPGPPPDVVQYLQEALKSVPSAAT